MNSKKTQLNSLTDNPESSFHKKLGHLKQNMVLIHQKMESEANDLKTKAFYDEPGNTFEDVDVDIVEE